MTRAEDELRCSWAAQRSFGGTPTERRLTPWLTGLAERQRDRPDDGAVPSPQWRRHLAEQRAALAGAAAPEAAEPLAALHAWRAERARAARAEPASVIDDHLLEAIAARMPATQDELVAVPGMGPLLAARVGDDLLAALHPSPQAS
jgi:DNA helicase-2/ATP-dependent DNA helicase PcrA